jgi:hypothetical protein
MLPSALLLCITGQDYVVFVEVTSAWIWFTCQPMPSKSLVVFNLGLHPYFADPRRSRLEATMHTDPTRMVSQYGDHGFFIHGALAGMLFQKLLPSTESGI